MRRQFHRANARVAGEFISNINSYLFLIYQTGSLGGGSITVSISTGLPSSTDTTPPGYVRYLKYSIDNVKWLTIWFSLWFSGAKRQQRQQGGGGGGGGGGKIDLFLYSFFDFRFSRLGGFGGGGGGGGLLFVVWLLSVRCDWSFSFR